MAVSVKCPNCGANLRFDADAQMMTCKHCDASITPEMIKTASSKKKKQTSPDQKAQEGTKDRTDKAAWDEDQTQQFVCDSCGASVITDQNTSATFCAFCGSPAIISKRITDGFQPDYIIPFKYGKDAAVERFYAWCKGGRMTPIDFVSDKNVEKITGLYVPFWLFDAQANVDIYASGTIVRSITTGNTTTTTTSYYDIIRKKKLKYAFLPLDAAAHIDDHMMEITEPFDYTQMVEFDLKYLLGFFADRYDTAAEELRDKLNFRLKKYIYDDFKDSTKNYTRTTIKIDKSVIDDPTSWYALMPLWFLNYKYHNKTYTFIMNGQTGKIVGKPPISRLKLTMLFFLLLALGAVLSRLLIGIILGGFVG